MKIVAIALAAAVVVVGLCFDYGARERCLETYSPESCQAAFR